MFVLFCFYQSSSVLWSPLHYNFLWVVHAKYYIENYKRAFSNITSSVALENRGTQPYGLTLLIAFEELHWDSWSSKLDQQWAGGSQVVMRGIGCYDIRKHCALGYCTSLCHQRPLPSSIWTIGDFYTATVMLRVRLNGDTQERQLSLSNRKSYNSMM